jgi:hypothetical protein
MNYILERDGIQVSLEEKPYVIVKDSTMLVCDERDAYVVYEQENGILRFIGWTTDSLLEGEGYVN